jgi:hypothetical protein
VTSDSELEVLKKIADTRKMDELIATISAHKMEASVDTLMKLHPSDETATDHSYWTIPVLLATSVTLTVVILYCCIHTYWGKLSTYRSTPETSEAPVHHHHSDSTTHTANTLR